MSKKALLHDFTTSLLAWWGTGKRSMPWKETKDPYKIWISEIILQQTRVSQGTDYYLRFIDRFPDIATLAGATEDEVLAMWKGLGYYTRARNIHATAKIVMESYQGIFPSTYKDIIQLRGIGPYTAAAISSFAYDLVHPVVDGNVIRVISRYFGIEEPVDDRRIRKHIDELAEELIHRERPADYNQAIMDLGAMVCAPRSPDCQNCCMSDTCVAYNKKWIDRIPLKAKKITKRHRFFHYLVIENSAYILLKKRQQKDIWQGLYDFPCVEKESETILSLEEIHSLLTEIGLVKNRVKRAEISKTHRQTLTHQYINGIFYSIPVNIDKLELKDGYFFAIKENLSNFAIPKLIDWYLGDKSITLF